MNTVLFENKLYVEGRKEWTSVHIQFPERENHLPRRRMDTPWRPQLDWCKERFGYANYLPMVWCYNGDGLFEFEREEDAVLFALRWV